MTDEAKALVERLRELERDLKPFAHKTVGSIRIDLDEVRAIVGCPDLIETQAREIGRLREALRQYVYETTSLSPLEDDGSHWCKISANCLSNARAALAGDSHDQ